MVLEFKKIQHVFIPTAYINFQDTLPMIPCITWNKDPNEDGDSLKSGGWIINIYI